MPDSDEPELPPDEKELPLDDLLLQVVGKGNLQYHIADNQLIISAKM